MNALELISRYKLKHTPLGIDDKILSFYRRSMKETSSNDYENYFTVVLNYDESIKTVIENSTFLKTMLENNSRKYIQLYTEFQNKWAIKKGFFNDFQENFVFDKIKYTLNSILELNPSYVTFDLTEDCSAFFQASINNKNVYFELFFTKDVDGYVEAVTNIYLNGKCIFAYGGSIDDTFSKINLRVEKKTWSFEPTPYQYDLSTSSLTTATF